MIPLWLSDFLHFYETNATVNILVEGQECRATGKYISGDASPSTPVYCFLDKQEALGR